MNKHIKKTLNLLLIFIMISYIFMPSFSVKAANEYSVQMVSGTGNNTVIGSYATYNEAVSVMNKQISTSTSVASVIKNGKILNSKYAIFQFSPNTSTINMYQTIGGSAYTYIRPSSMTDSAFLDSNENKVQIMHEGFKGWVDLSAGTIIPISLLGTNTVVISTTGLRLRQSASLSGTIITTFACTNQMFVYTAKTTADGYTWYKISYNGTTGWVAGDSSWLYEAPGTNLATYYYRWTTDNLIHQYAYHNGSSYVDSFSNLGPSPTYLTVGTNYYSFDGGIYLYTSLLTMLDDYRNNRYTNSLNANNPNYPYYLFQPSKTSSKVTAAELNAQITNKNSKMYGTGAYFKEAESLYGMNSLSAFAKARAESADGTSSIAMNKNNIFGYGAADSCPYECAKTYATVYDSIIDYAKNSLGSYTTAQAKYYFGSHPGTKGSGRNVKYASDPMAGEKEASVTYSNDLKTNGMKDYKASTVGVTAYGKYNIAVYKDASGSTKIYNMQNIDASLKVYDIPVTVIDKEGDYYKIYSESPSYDYGYIKTSDLYVSNKQPIITASDQTIALNSSFNPLTGVTAIDQEDGNLTSKISYSGNVDTTKSGTYNITYKVTDNQNFSVSKKITITVKGASEPIINATDKEVAQFTSFDPLNEVTATDDLDGDITSQIIVEGTVDTNTKGTYSIVYKVTNSKGKTSSKTINIKVIDNEKPVINVTNLTAYLNKNFDPLNGVTAIDKEDGDLTAKILITKNDVDTSTIGDYEVIYSVTDNAGQNTTKTVMVSVIEKILIEKDSQFYMDYLKNVNGKLQLKGYNTIQGINNTLNNNIQYKIIFIDNETGQIYSDFASRITNTNEMTRPIYSSDGKDYTYSWFKIDIDFDNLPQGNYTLKVISESDDYYSENIISNKLDKTQDSSYSGSKEVIIRNNYSYSKSPVELIVRDEKIANKTAGTYYNQYDTYREFAFNTDNTLHLKGVSYSYGMDLAASKNVNRKIVFENMKTFKTYVKDLGSITNGPYEPVLPVSDNLSKTRSWYDANIDISDIPKGKYYIYITTSSNITDVYELTEKLNRNLDNVSKTIDSKKYSFNINFSKGNRIELLVE